MKPCPYCSATNRVYADGDIPAVCTECTDGWINDEEENCMPTLTFVKRPQYGHDRLFPTNPEAVQLVGLIGRKCLTVQEMILFRKLGLVIKVFSPDGPEILEVPQNG